MTRPTARTDRYLVATAYFAWSADRMARKAGVLGKHDDEERFARLAAGATAPSRPNTCSPTGA